MAYSGPYFYKEVKGWDKEDTKYEVYRENWDDEWVATFADEGVAAKFVREHNEEELENAKRR